jgi:hypothetical protein
MLRSHRESKPSAEADRTPSRSATPHEAAEQARCGDDNSAKPGPGSRQDPTLAALAVALERASATGHWSTVARLAAVLARAMPEALRDGGARTPQGEAGAGLGVEVAERQRGGGHAAPALAAVGSAGAARPSLGSAGPDPTPGARASLRVTGVSPAPADGSKGPALARRPPLVVLAEIAQLAADAPEVVRSLHAFAARR